MDDDRLPWWVRHAHLTSDAGPLTRREARRRWLGLAIIGLVLVVVAFH